MARPSPRLGDPHIRLLLGAGTLVVTALAVRCDGVAPGETRAFEALNDLPDRWAGPVWVVMQAGNLLAAPVAAAAAGAAGRRDTARRLLASGTLTWVLSKAVKGAVRRPRPTSLVAGARRRGRAQTGSGFVSGHAAVAASLCAAGLPELPPAYRAAAVTTAVMVGAARVYVAAHLPLDVVGGAALGIAAEAAIELAGG